MKYTYVKYNFVSAGMCLNTVTTDVSIFFHTSVTMEPWGKDYKASFKNSGSRVIQKLADLMQVGPLTRDGLHDVLVKK